MSADAGKVGVLVIATAKYRRYREWFSLKQSHGIRLMTREESESFLLIGAAMGQAMLGLLHGNGNPSPRSP